MIERCLKNGRVVAAASGRTASGPAVRPGGPTRPCERGPVLCQSADVRRRVCNRGLVRTRTCQQRQLLLLQREENRFHWAHCQRVCLNESGRARPAQNAPLGRLLSLPLPPPLPAPTCAACNQLSSTASARPVGTVCLSVRLCPSNLRMGIKFAQKPTIDGLRISTTT